MALGVPAIIDALTSKAGALGVFDAVNAHEPKNAPGAGVACSVWCSKMSPAPEASGLAVASVLVEFQMRIYTSMLQEPQDGIEPSVLAAADLVFTALIGGFTLGGNVRDVDVFGAHSEGLRAEAGYLNQDGKLFRVMDIHVPMIVSDVHPEVA